MNDHVSQLLIKQTRAKDALAHSQRELDSINRELSSIQSSCFHLWLEPIERSQTTPGYTIPGDEPGTMGADRREDFYVEAKTKVWYERKCALCGKVESTTETTSAGVKPVFH